MLTPLEISLKLSLIAEKENSGGQFAQRLAFNLRAALYEEVLTEIAEGSIDPRSLALAVLNKLF